MRTFRQPIFLLALLGAPSAQADELRWPIDISASPIPAPIQINKESLRDVPAEYLNDAAACYLYSGTTHTLEPDGTLAMTVHEAIRLNNSRAIDEFGEYRSIAFVPAYEKVALHAARVHKSTGETLDVLPRHVHVRDINTDHLVYDSSKVVVLSFPRLQVGDIIEVSWTVRGKHPEYGDHFFHRYSFGDDKYPVARDEWTVRLPKSRTLRHAAINGELPVTIEESGDQKVYSWRATNRPAPPPGERKPAGDDERWQIACSTFPSWAAVHEWERSILANRCNCPPTARTLVADLTKNSPDDQSKARVLAQYVSQNIRYLSRGDKHDYTPHAPANVLRDCCGDCKDSANLLAAMMREAGLKAAVATLGPRGDGQVLESLPSPWGTHALTVVTIDGRDFWIDTTARRLGWNVLPHDDCDRVCFITDPNGIRLARTPKSKPELQRTESTTHLKIASNGDAVGEHVLRYSGIAAWVKREELADKSKTEQRAAIAGELREMFPRSTLTKLSCEALDDPNAPLVIRAVFAAPELFSGEGTLEAKLGDTAFLSELLTAPANPERRSALEIGDISEFVCRFEIELPPVFRFTPGLESESAKSRWCEWDVKVQHRTDQPRKLEIHSHAVITSSQVEVDDLAEWSDFQDALQATIRVPVQIQVTRNPADIPLLSEVCAKSPDDAPTSVALAELYLAEQKLHEAGQLLQAARAASPGERKLWDLSLLAAEQIDDQERVYRSMLARFPDDPKIAIELAQNLIDQDRPADAQTILDPLTEHKQPAIRAAAFIELAHCNMSQEEPKKALRHLDQAQKADAGQFSADAWFLKAQIHESMREHQLALDSYRHVLKMEEASDALECAARMALALNRESDALDFWRRLAVAAQDEPESLALAADLAVRLGRIDDAIDLASHALTAKDELHPLAYRPLGLARLHRGEFDEAVRHLRKSAIDPEVLVGLVQAQIALGRLSEAEQQIGRFNAIEPTSDSRQTVDWIKKLAARRLSAGPKVLPASTTDSPRSASLDRAICAEALDSRNLWPNQVRRLLQEAIDDPSPSASAYGLRAVLRMRQGNFTAAMKDANQALSQDPDEPNACHVLGKVRLERGDKKGLADLEHAARLSTRKNARLLHDLAWGYANADRLSEALATQREAASLRPGDTLIRDQLDEFETVAKAREKAPATPGP